MLLYSDMASWRQPGKWQRGVKLGAGQRRSGKESQETDGAKERAGDTTAAGRARAPSRLVNVFRPNLVGTVVCLRLPYKCSFIGIIQFI